MGNGILFFITILSLAGAAASAFFIKRIFAPTPKISLDESFADAGFDYDKKQNIFYSRMDAWQRDYGYSSLYDEVSAPMGLIFDCEPVRFEYRGKHWLIELWKGQYGMTTGFEIGIYTFKAGSAKPPSDVLYTCAADEDMLPMTLTARKNSRVLFKRSGVHWWLTGFILGEFSEPEELSMDVSITFKDREMLQMFGESLVELGYPAKEIGVMDNTAFFSFNKPRSKQPRENYAFMNSFSQWRSKQLCEKYKRLTENAPNVYEAAAVLRKKAPALFKKLLSMSKPFKLFKKRLPGRIK